MTDNIILSCILISLINIGLTSIIWDPQAIYSDEESTMDKLSKKYNTSKVFFYFWSMLLCVPIWVVIYYSLKFIVYTSPVFLFKNTMSFLKAFKTKEPNNLPLLVIPNNTEISVPPEQLIEISNKIQTIITITNNLELLLTEEELIIYSNRLNQFKIQRQNSLVGSLTNLPDVQQIPFIENKPVVDNTPTFEII